VAPPDRLRPAFDALLAASASNAVLSLDALAEALAPFGASHEEIDAVIEALEAAGRVVGPPEDGRLEDVLKQVLVAARSLASTLGRSATVAEIASHARLSEARVRQALELAKVLQR
jgi:hypothetical protein